MCGLTGRKVIGVLCFAVESVWNLACPNAKLYFAAERARVHSSLNVLKLDGFSSRSCSHIAMHFDTLSLLSRLKTEEFNTVNVISI